MSRVILVRHGETELNRQLRYSGQLDATLTAAGQAQEARLLASLAAIPISRVVSSSVPHVLRLAELLAAQRHLHAEADPDLREASFGRWEGLTYAEAMQADRPEMVAFNRGAADAAPPLGESVRALAARVRARFDALEREQRGRDGALLIVSHGGTLRALLCSLLHIPIERHWTLRINPASVTVFDTYPLGPIVAVLNDTCHLQGLG